MDLRSYAPLHSQKCAASKAFLTSKFAKGLRLHIDFHTLRAELQTTRTFNASFLLRQHPAARRSVHRGRLRVTSNLSLELVGRVEPAARGKLVQRRPLWQLLDVTGEVREEGAVPVVLAVELAVVRARDRKRRPQRRPDVHGAAVETAALARPGEALHRVAGDRGRALRLGPV